MVPYTTWSRLPKVIPPPSVRRQAQVDLLEDFSGPGIMATTLMSLRQPRCIVTADDWLLHNDHTGSSHDSCLPRLQSCADVAIL